MFKKTILAAALLASFPVFAGKFYLVVPVAPMSLTSPAESISVSLNAYALPAGVVGRAYAGFDFNSVLQVSGDPSFDPRSVKWTLVQGALPAGLSLSASGQLVGTPTAASTAGFQVMATYKTKTGQMAYQVVVGEVSISLAEAALPAGVQGAAYHYDLKPRLVVSGDPDFAPSSVAWSLASGTLPAGLQLNSDGTITGTPGAEGAHPFTVQASYLGKSGERQYQVVVGAITVSLASANLPAVKIGDSYNVDLKPKLTVSGDAAYMGDGAGVAWDIVNGSLPAGVTLGGSGVIMGTPTEIGTKSFTAKATYKAKSVQQDYAIQVNPRGLALQAGGYRTWDDGAVAQSCKAYREGTIKYAYTGDVGNGVYRIQPPSWPATNVYCDMTTDGGGWMLAAWNKGNAGIANMPADFFVRQINAANIANRDLANASSSINVEGQGIWSYDTPDCRGPLGHTGRNAGCTNHYGNDNWDTVDRFNIAIYPGDTSIVPAYLNSGNELCWSGRGWCNFEFYLR